MKQVPTRFLQDPDWYQVEELVLEFINPLLDLSTVDMTQPAEHVKAEILGRKMSYDALIGLTRASGMVRAGKLPENKENIFK